METEECYFLLSLDRIRKLNIDLRADLLITWTEQEKELFTERYEKTITEGQIFSGEKCLRSITGYATFPGFNGMSPSEFQKF